MGVQDVPKKVAIGPPKPQFFNSSGSQGHFFEKTKNLFLDKV